MVQADVDEALRLMKMSKISLYDDNDRRQQFVDPISDIFARIREDITRTKQHTYSWETVLGLCRGFTV